jgi:ribulose-phosphate 3-epimerase
MTRTVRVIPAILTDDSSELARLIGLANTFAPCAQIDIMDGIFVPTRSIEVDDVRRQDIVFSWDVHLMVADPMRYFEPFRDAGATGVLFHVESDVDPREAVSHARALGLAVGVVLNPPTPVADIEGILPLVDSVMLMTVYPGYYGAPFVPEVMCKVGQIRAVSSGVEIVVDGGIKESNILDVARQGVDTVCVGSAVFACPDPAASYARLVALVDGL